MKLLIVFLLVTLLALGTGLPSIARSNLPTGET